LLACLTVATLTAGPTGSAAAARPKLGAADRAAISALLDRFVVFAVARKNPAAAYDLATADLREGMTRAEWATGSIPVFPFSPRGTHFPWTLNAIVEGKVSIELLLQPRNRKAGALAYDVEVEKVGGRWLVDQIQTVAAFAPPTGKASVAGPKDYQAGSSQSTGGESRLSLVWLGLAVASIVAVIAGIVLFVVLRNTRRRRRIESEFRRRGDLPPLPGSR
jgi:hypothetical protein